MYEIRYGLPERYKSITTDDLKQAMRMYDKIKKFAEQHELTWIVSLWDKDWRLIKSETINPTETIYI